MKCFTISGVQKEQAVGCAALVLLCRDVKLEIVGGNNQEIPSAGLILVANTPSRPLSLERECVIDATH